MKLYCQAINYDIFHHLTYAIYYYNIFEFIYCWCDCVLMTLDRGAKD